MRHLRGHLLMFGEQEPSTLGGSDGVRLLAVAGIAEVARLAAVWWLDPRRVELLVLPALPVIAVLLAIGIAGVPPSQLGFRRWSQWSTTEKSYFVQVVVLANVVFPLALAAPLAESYAERGVVAFVVFTFLPYLCYGFYQEIVYRGMVQQELVRRWGAVAGILASTLLFTFGPLHSQYFAARPGVAVPMFAAIFVMGLFFGLLYRRSGNLWLPAVFHALGNAWMVSALGERI